ncbi:glycoside hydrolase family 3 C-terminal domain-containing protein [candidate division KSB1 bacterium]|nr:glycoside hydrolase family 3 C-terminal domain-containing protein [candidate division KSB1 bacterium]
MSDAQNPPKYLNKNSPIDERVDDLLKQMSLEEKVYQMVGYGDFINVDIFIVEEGRYGYPRMEEALFHGILDNGEFSFKKATKAIGKGLGQLSTIGRYCTPQKGAERANAIQKFAIEETRLGIPIIIHDECLHGLMAIHATSFPQAIALASTWDDELMQEIAVAIGKETRSRGIHHCLSPTINIARDPRCGRTEETYGEDPFLCSRMAVAYVKGVQGEGVACTPKHFVANFVGIGGRDSNEIELSERNLRDIYFPAFKACVQEADALSIMAAYNSLDGIPCSSNKWLLTDVLRKEWGFKGVVVSDYFSVLGLYDKHRTGQDKGDAAKQAVEAGLDIELPHPDCYLELVDLVENGKMSIDSIDDCVKRILWFKFKLGLFDNPYVNPEDAKKINDCKEHRALALKVAQKSIVLLKNNQGLLPLNKDIRSIAVIGPNADEERLGGYSGKEIKIVTPLEGIQNRAPENVSIQFAQGCDVLDDSQNGFKKAVDIAKAADVALLFMGNSVMTEGESRDRSNLDLPGVQETLIQEIIETGTPVIVVLISGSVITMGKWVNDVRAIIEAWYPGEEGGNAIADVLFGHTNPGGRLPITCAKTIGQLPLYYNYKPSGRDDDYMDLRGEQTQFPFGYGLSYTTFEFSIPKLQKTSIKKDESTSISVDVTNTGKMAGDEVVQMYIRDKVSSIVRPVKELKGFKRVSLQPGEMQTVTLDINPEKLAFYNMDMEFVVEPGEFEIMVGNSSDDKDLETVVLTVIG